MSKPTYSSYLIEDSKPILFSDMYDNDAESEFDVYMEVVTRPSYVGQPVSGCGPKALIARARAEISAREKFIDDIESGKIVIYSRQNVPKACETSAVVAPAAQ